MFSICTACTQDSAGAGGRTAVAEKCESLKAQADPASDTVLTVMMEIFCYIYMYFSAPYDGL